MTSRVWTTASAGRGLIDTPRVIADDIRRNSGKPARFLQRGVVHSDLPVALGLEVMIHVEQKKRPNKSGALLFHVEQCQRRSGITT